MKDVESIQADALPALTALAVLGIQFIQETGASDFSVSAVFPHTSTGDKYKAVFKFEKEEV